MPWQETVANVGLELDEDGAPAYREVVVTVPRQSGKTILGLAWEIQRALGWDGPQRIVYSAQTGNDARKKLVEDQLPLLERRASRLGIRAIHRGMGNEAVVWRNGSRLVLLASSIDSGHGKTVDLAVKDEYFADYDDRRDQALIPAMATRHFGQTLTMSTMGTDDSIPLNRVVERGRAAVDSGQRYGIAYFEWSADPEADLWDRDVWRSCMPALGHTISEAVVAHARDSMSEGEFRRAFLNVRMSGSEVVVPGWSQLLDANSTIAECRTFALDVAPDRRSAAFGMAGRRADGLLHVETFDHRAGTGWVLQRGSEIAAHERTPIWIDRQGPAASFVGLFRERGVEVVEVSTADHVQACGQFLDAALNGQLRHLGQSSLDTALHGAEFRRSNDAQLWGRRSSRVDITPLVAVTLALGAVPRKATVEPWAVYR